MRGEAENVRGRGQRQTHWNVTFFVSGLEACSVKARLGMFRMSARRLIMSGRVGASNAALMPGQKAYSVRGKAENVRGRAKASKMQHCNVSFFVSGLGPPKKCFQNPSLHQNPHPKFWEGGSTPPGDRV